VSPCTGGQILRSLPFLAGFPTLSQIDRPLRLGPVHKRSSGKTCYQPSELFAHLIKQATQCHYGMTIFSLPC